MIVLDGLVIFACPDHMQLVLLLHQDTQRRNTPCCMPQAVPWDDLRYMFGEVFYGGHITDGMDRRCCTTYLEVRQ